MSDKLQEIETKLRNNITDANAVVLTVADGIELLHRLEQAQTERDQYKALAENGTKLAEQWKADHNQLLAANQKLVECLERIEGCTMSMFSTSENMSIYMISLAQQTLSEVKGNGNT
ncbi:hypothetical protein [Paenibacillus camelliae]|uniref:hypothetical protein n=1 Tax=Paenibacillus camelliae TaxID=512410 RepID=UPI0020418C27|nr:hypothetical protein [Paenibacillus camelliae]MCM3632884.1 hypothetical protein [Paenibacillus camelliae]